MPGTCLPTAAPWKWVLWGHVSMLIANEVAAEGDGGFAVGSMLEALAGLHIVHGVKHRQVEAGRGDL